VSVLAMVRVRSKDGGALMLRDAIVLDLSDGLRARLVALQVERVVDANPEYLRVIAKRAPLLAVPAQRALDALERARAAVAGGAS